MTRLGFYISIIPKEWVNGCCFSISSTCWDRVENRVNLFYIRVAWPQSFNQKKCLETLVKVWEVSVGDMTLNLSVWGWNKHPLWPEISIWLNSSKENPGEWVEKLSCSQDSVLHDYFQKWKFWLKSHHRKLDVQIWE